MRGLGLLILPRFSGKGREKDGKGREQDEKGREQGHMTTPIDTVDIEKDFSKLDSDSARTCQLQVRLEESDKILPYHQSGATYGRGFRRELLTS